MKVSNYNNYRVFDYHQNVTNDDDFQLGDIVFKKGKFEGKDCSEVGIIIQIHEPCEFRTEMFGNCSTSELKLATRKQVKKYRPDLLKDLCKF